MIKHRAWLTISGIVTAAGVFGLLGRSIRWIWQLSRLFSVPTGAASVGIIGGADGPTALFVTASHYRVPLLGYLILTLIGIAGILWSLGKQKQE